MHDMYRENDLTHKEQAAMKTNIVVTSSPTKLATPTDLGEKARTSITEAINPLIADVFALFVKTKNYHWHVSGPHYRDYHLLLDEQSDQIFAMIDVLAERVRKLGGTTIRSINQIASMQHIKDDNDVFVEPNEMIKRLMDDNKDIAKRMRDVHKICDSYNDVATASLLEVFIDETERRVWFLFEIQVR